MTYTILYYCAIYLVVWWVSIFIVLPIGIRSRLEVDDSAGAVNLDDEPEALVDRGSPRVTLLKKKFLLNTVFAALITAIIATLEYSVWFSEFSEMITPSF